MLIIGSGFGGSVAAARLTEAGRDVVLLERGPWRDTLPVASMNVRDRIALPRSSWLQTISKSLSRFIGCRLTGPRGVPLNRRHGTLELNNYRGLVSVCASQVGGGSLVWGGVMLRPPGFWDGRAEGVSEEIMTPHFDLVSNELEATSFTLSEPGPVNWSKELGDREWIDFSVDADARWAHRMPGEGEKAASPLGIERASSRFAGHLSLGCVDGSKASSDSIWLGPAIARGLKLIASCEVTRIRRTDDGYEVYAQRTGGELELQVRCQNLLMGAGTSNTLRLLMEAEKRGDLESMPALGQGISGNGDELAILWNVKASEQEDVRRGMGSLFHLRRGSRDVVHGFIESDLPRPRWRLLRRLLRPLLNSLIVVSIGPDGSDGQASLVDDRMQIDFDAASSPANQTGRSEHREVAKRLGVKALFFPKAVTAHLCGGARVGASRNEGVVKGNGECWTNPGLFVVDATAIPEATALPPSLNIAAWSSHVADGISRRSAHCGTTIRADVAALLARANRRQLAALFSLLPYDPEDSEDLVGAWQANLLSRVRGRCARHLQLEIDQFSEVLETLKPPARALPGVVPASAWDGSGLCWQWREKNAVQPTDIQFRPLPDAGGMLARVRQDDGPEGWYLLSRAD